MIILINKILENKDYAPNMKLNATLRQFVDNSGKCSRLQIIPTKSTFSPH